MTTTVRMAGYRRLLARATGGTVGIVIGIMLACIVVPIGVTVLMSFWSVPFGASGGHATLSSYAQALTNSAALHWLANTLIITVVVGVLSTALAFLLAWITTSTDIPWRRVLFWLPVSPILLPVLLLTTSWVMLYAPRTGLFNVWLHDLVGFSALNIYTLYGMIIVLTLGTTPIAYLVIAPALQALDQSVLEVSRISGANWLRTLRKIIVPSVRPAILSALALAALIASTAFEVPVLIGRPAKITTYMSTIYETITQSGGASYNLAAAYSVVYLVLGGLLLGWYMRATRSSARFAAVHGRGYAHKVTKVGWVRWVLAAIVVLYFLAAFVQLLLATIFMSFLPYYSPLAGHLFNILTTSGYSSVLGSQGSTISLWQALRTSVVLGLIVAVVTTFFSLVMTYVSGKTRMRARGLVGTTATIPVALPPTVFSLALLVTVLFVPGLSTLYNTPFPMAIALVVVFLPFGVRFMSGALIQISDDLLGAARVCGARPARMVATIVAPMLSTAILNTFLYVFTVSFRELGAVVLLVTPNLPLLPTVIFSEWNDGGITQTAVLNIISVLIPLAVALVIVLARLANRARRDARKRRIKTFDQLPEVVSVG